MFIKTLSATMVMTVLTGFVGSMAMAAQLTAPIKRDGIVMDDEQKTLYTSDSDTAGKSSCVGDCAKTWKPLYATKASKTKGDYTVIQREDGTKQWAYKEKPLYTFSTDKKKGDKNGDNADGVWHIVQ